MSDTAWKDTRTRLAQLFRILSPSTLREVGTGHRRSAGLEIVKNRQSAYYLIEYYSIIDRPPGHDADYLVYRQGFICLPWIFA